MAEDSAAPSAAAAAAAATVPAAQFARTVRAQEPPLIPPRFDAPQLSNPQAEYPRLSRRMGEQGRVMLRVYVDSGGNPDKVELYSSSGSSRLDRAAREAVARWKFIPARQGDQSVGAWLLVPVLFRLDG